MKTGAVFFEKSGTGKTVVASKLHEGYMRQGERAQYIAIHERLVRGDYMSENEIMLSGGTNLCDAKRAVRTYVILWGFATYFD